MASLTAAGVAAARHHPRLAARRLLARHPEVWVYGVSVAAGASLLVAAGHHGGEPVPRAGRAVEWPDPPSLLAGWGGWMVMVLAMMLPVIAPHARLVGVRSLRRRRHRAMVGYLAGYLAVWALAGVAVVAALHGAGLPHPPAGLTVAALLGAAVWQVAEPRRRAMRRCGAPRMGAAKGPAADRDCATAGWVAGLRCAFTCGPVMVATAAAHHQPALMTAILVLLLTERASGPNPSRRAGRAAEAWALVGLAAGVAVVAVG